MDSIQMTFTVHAWKVVCQLRDRLYRDTFDRHIRSQHESITLLQHCLMDASMLCNVRGLTRIEPKDVYNACCAHDIRL